MQWFIRYKHYFFLIILGFVVFSHSLNNEFVLDDKKQIVYNGVIRSLNNIPTLFASSTFFSGGAEKLSGGFYRPMMMFVYTLIYNLFGPNPSPFHTVQVALHIINACLIFALFKKWFHPNLAFFLSAVFVIHPMNVETVVYIADLQDVLFQLFGLVGLSVVIGTIQLPKTIKSSWCLFLLFLCALLSKETGIVYIIMAVIYQYVHHNKKLKEVATPAIYAFIIYVIAKATGVGLFPPKQEIIAIASASITTKLLTLPKIISFYFTTYVYPSHLSIMPQWIVAKPTIHDFFTPLLFIITLCSGIYLLYHKKNVAILPYHQLNFFIIWIGIGILLHANLISLDATVADRWFYFPQIGLLGFVGMIIQYKLKLSNKVKTASLVTGLILVIVYSIRSYIRINDWQSEYILAAHDIQVDPENPMIQNIYGNNLIIDHKYDESIAIFQKIVTKLPQWGTAWNNLGFAYEQKGDLSSLAQAEKAYLNAINQNQSYLAYANLGNLYLKQELFSDTLGIVETGLNQYPNNPALWFLYAQANLGIGDKNKAYQAAQKAYTLQPTNDVNQFLSQLTK